MIYVWTCFLVLSFLGLAAFFGVAIVTSTVEPSSDFIPYSLNSLYSDHRELCAFHIACAGLQLYR